MVQMLRRPDNLTGERALLVSVIATAVKDCLRAKGENRASAWQYLASETYRHDLSLLGLPADMLPVAIEELVDER